MKRYFQEPRSIMLLFVFLAAVTVGRAQSGDTGNNRMYYTYTFEGMKDSTEALKMDEEILRMPAVVSSKTIFKSSAHTYSQLRVEVKRKRSESDKVTEPEDLKALLLKKGYIPGDFKMSREPHTN